MLACVANFSGTPKPDYRVGLPFAGRWREVLNTDAQIYGGSGVGNLGAVEAEPTMWHGRPASAVLQLPPSGVLWLVPEPFGGAVRRRVIATADAPAEESTAPVTPSDDAVTGEEDVVDQAPSAPVTDELPEVAPPVPDLTIDDVVAGDEGAAPQEPEDGTERAAIGVDAGGPSDPTVPSAASEPSDGTGAAETGRTTTERNNTAQ